MIDQRWSDATSTGCCSAGAPGVTDVLIGEVHAAFGKQEAATLLPACGADTVGTLLPDLEHALNLERLIRWHSGPVPDRVR